MPHDLSSVYIIGVYIIRTCMFDVSPPSPAFGAGSRGRPRLWRLMSAASGWAFWPRLNGLLQAIEALAQLRAIGLVGQSGRKEENRLQAPPKAFRQASHLR